MEERIEMLERRVAMLENMLNLMTAKVTAYKKPYKPSYKKYVVVTNDEETLSSMVFSLYEMTKVEVTDCPNVSYIKIPGKNNFEIVIITDKFFRHWKETHRKFYKVSFEELCDILEKQGIA